MIEKRQSHLRGMAVDIPTTLLFRLSCVACKYLVKFSREPSYDRFTDILALVQYLTTRETFHITCIGSKRERVTDLVIYMFIVCN